MEHTKKAKLLLVETNDASVIFKSIERTLSFEAEPTKFKWGNNQNLYVITDDLIKKGDWVVRKNYNNRYVGDIFSDLPFNQIIQAGHDCSSTPLAKKIIATTDKSLGLPSIPQVFVKFYVTEFNKNNIIVDVLVLCEEYFSPDGEYWCQAPNPSWEQGCSKIELKIDSSDNSISIKPEKVSWNRIEVEALLRERDANKEIHIDNWINQKL